MKNGIVPHSKFTQTHNKEQFFPVQYFFPFPSLDLNCGHVTGSKGESGSAFYRQWLNHTDIFLPHLVSCASWTHRGSFLILLRDQFCFCTHARFLQWAIEGLTKVYRFMNAFWTNGIFTEKVCENSRLYHRRLINTTLYLCNEAPSMRFQVHSCVSFTPKSNLEYSESVLELCSS